MQRLIFPLLALLPAAVAAGEHPLVDPDARNAIPVAPRIVTEAVKHDTDDPAIWINHADPAASLIIGTDKDVDGALYVFGLDGKIQWDKTVRGLLRPNNVDVAYDVPLAGGRVDVAVTTERYAHRLRVYRLPDMAPIDGGGIPVFESEVARECMGIALYTRAGDGALFAIVSRSPVGAPGDGYLHQYRLVDDGTGTVRGLLVRRFGAWSGKKEIEAVAVDDASGFVYYSDESFGVRKYHADPLADDADEELANFGTIGLPKSMKEYPTTNWTSRRATSWSRTNRRTLFACSPVNVKLAIRLRMPWYRACACRRTRATAMTSSGRRSRPIFPEGCSQRCQMTGHSSSTHGPTLPPPG